MHTAAVEEDRKYLCWTWMGLHIDLECLLHALQGNLRQMCILQELLTLAYDDKYTVSDLGFNHCTIMPPVGSN